MTHDGQMESMKSRFLSRYNWERTHASAESDAIKSAVQHNSLYSPSASQAARGRVVSAWKGLLRETAEAYRNVVSPEQYEADFMQLADTMNRDFSVDFRSDPHPRFQYAPGLRLSHAQKSLSVYLKHLWCLGEIEEPPECPIDRIVLQAARAPEAERKWTAVNSLDDHHTKLGYVRSAAQEVQLSPAVWELKVFGE